MRTIYIILVSIMLPFTVMAQSSGPVGDWSPDSKCWIGEIKIKQTDENEYKIKITREGGVEVFSATLNDGELYGKYQDVKLIEYGEYWVGTGPIEKGKEKEILVGNGYSYGSNGAVGGWLGDNVNYRLTNSRRNCATVEKPYRIYRLVINGDSMTVYCKYRTDYLKDGQPMFYSESYWGPGFKYSKW